MIATTLAKNDILITTMAVYKVPQDVEADDKLIEPFSFRQFIYLIIVALSLALAWGLGQLFIPLAVIPLPIIILFGALALRCVRINRWRSTWPRSCHFT